MKQTEIFVEISEQGDVSVEVSGHVGPGCAKLTENIERALGTVAKDTKKPEYNRQEVKNVATNRR